MVQNNGFTVVCNTPFDEPLKWFWGYSEFGAETVDEAYTKVLDFHASQRLFFPLIFQKNRGVVAYRK